MTTHDPKLAKILRMLAAAKPEQVQRLIEDIRQTHLAPERVQ
jgi:hypothetical protein